MKYRSGIERQNSITETQRGNMIRRIIADCSADITQIEGADFRSVPLMISTEERSFSDDEKLDLNEMLDYLASYHGRSFTACPGPDQWLNAYEGADEIFVVTLSGALSGTYNAAKTAGDMYMEEHHGTKVHVFDTRSAGPEVRMLAERLAEYIREGKSFEEICRLGADYNSHTRIFFALESFHNFAENGRVSKVVAAAAGMLGIRVLATGSSEGEIETVAKCRGEAGVLKAFISNLEKALYRNGRIYIAHCFNEGLTEKLKKMLLERFDPSEIVVYETRGLCSFYAEKGGVLLGFECAENFK